MIFLFYLFLNYCMIVNSARPKRHRCLETNRFAWSDTAPYTNISTNGSHVGILEQIFFQAMSTCCAGESHNVYSIQFKSQAGVSELLMNDSTRNNIDFVLPVQRDSKSKNFLVYPFVPLVVSPGLAVFVAPSKQGVYAIFHTVKSMIPFCTIIFICVGIAGTLFWLLDNMTLVACGESPEPFREGIISGIWWAFVTMTTVGYGDVIPKTKPARIFSVLWVIVGLTFCGLCVSSLTTGILVSITKTEIELMNHKVAVLRASEEYKYAAKKQAITYEYDSVYDVIEALRSKNVSIALLDAMVAGSYSHMLEEFTLNKVIESMSSNGVIFVNEGSKFAQCMREYIMDRQQEVLNLVSKNVKVVQYSSFKGDAVLIDPSLPMFRFGILSMLGTLLFFIISGVSRDWFARSASKRKASKRKISCQHEKMKRQKEELLKLFKDVVGVCEFFIENLEKQGKKF